MWHWINNLVLCSHILNCGLRKKLTSLRRVISINELKQLSSSGLEKSLSYYWVSDFISTEDLVNNWAYLTAFCSVCIFEHVFLSWACETAEDKRFLWKNWDAQSYYNIIEGKSIKWLKLFSKSKANRSAHYTLKDIIIFGSNFDFTIFFTTQVLSDHDDMFCHIFVTYFKKGKQ